MGLLLRPYPEWLQSTVQKDDNALQLILNMTDGTGNLARWRLWLSAFDFEVVRRSGIKHLALYALFCLFWGRCTGTYNSQGASRGENTETNIIILEYFPCNVGMDCVNWRCLTFSSCRPQPSVKRAYDMRLWDLQGDWHLH